MTSQQHADILLAADQARRAATNPVRNSASGAAPVSCSHGLPARHLIQVSPQPPEGWQVIIRPDGSQYARPLHTTLAAGIGNPALWDGPRMRVIEMGASHDAP